MSRIDEGESHIFCIKKIAVFYLAADKGIAAKFNSLCGGCGEMSAADGNSGDGFAAADIAESAAAKGRFNEFGKFIGGERHLKLAYSAKREGVGHHIEVTDIFKSQSIGEGIVNTARSKIQIGVGADNGDVVLHKLGKKAVCCQLFKRMEDHGVVSNDDFCTQRNSLVNGSISDVKCEQNAIGVAFGRADEESGVVPILGGGERCKFVYKIL